MKNDELGHEEFRAMYDLILAEAQKPVAMTRKDLIRFTLCVELGWRFHADARPLDEAPTSPEHPTHKNFRVDTLIAWKLGYDGRERWIQMLQGMLCNMWDEKRICHLCESEVKAAEWCQSCVEAMPKRPNAASMTKKERADELRSLRGPLEVPFHVLHGRVEELVGRPVLTHEWADPEALCNEILQGKRASTVGQDAPIMTFVVAIPLNEDSNGN